MKLLYVTSVFSIFFQKRDSSLIGSSDKSSGAKSTSTPSTPQAESGNNVGSRLSHSLPAESSPSADHISEAIEDKDLHEDSLLGQETPLVCNWLLFSFYLNAKYLFLEFVRCHIHLTQQENALVVVVVCKMLYSLLY